MFKGVIVTGSIGRICSCLVTVGMLILIGILAGGCKQLPRKLAVCEIQGGGLESPYLDQEVIASGLVIADLEGVEPGGFIILDETCSLAGESSPGVYVSLVEGDDLVDLGDQVRVRGFVREIGGETRLEARRSGLEFLSLDNPLPDPIDLMDYLIPPLVFGYERWEGLLVSIPTADIVEAAGSMARVHVLPQLILDPSQQLVCFQGEALSLEINGDLLTGGLEDFQSASELEKLVGYIRQDQSGYFLQLREEPALKIRDLKSPTEEISPVSKAGILAETQKPSITPTKSPTASPEPSPRPTLTSSPTIIPSPTYYPITLLITEVLPNPSGEEPGGEWIEIYYPGPGRLPLDGIKIGDEISPSGKEGMLRFPDGFFVHEGQVLIIANQAQVFSSRYGFLPDFELLDSDSRVPDLLPYNRWGRSTVKLSNTGDEVLLVDPWDDIVDLVVYGTSGAGGFSPPVEAPKEDHSLERYPAEVDRDQASDWRIISSPSPGRLDRSLPTGTATQTWVPSPSQTSVVPSMTTTISPTPVISETSSTATDIPEPTATLTQTSTSTKVPTSTPLPSETPVMTYTPSPSPSPDQTVMVTPTVTSTRETPETTPSSTASITTGTATPSTTPTEEATFTATPGPLVLINEILADPDPILGDSNQDGEVSSDDDEFLELVNVSGRLLDISGWQVFDEVRLRYTFPEGTSFPCGCALVLFGGGDPSGTFGGSLVFTAGSLGLNNTGDFVTLVDGEGILVTALGYGSEADQNQSLTRNPDLSGPLPLVLHSEVPGSDGRLFSPGTRVDLTGFGSCP